MRPWLPSSSFTPLTTSLAFVRVPSFFSFPLPKFDYFSFSSLLLADPGKQDPRREKKVELSEDAVSFWWAASAGDLYRIRQLIARGINPSCADYDKRSALHLAAGNGHLSVVQYLCFCGTSVTSQDRFGNTALDDAIRLKRSQVISFLKEFTTPTSEKSPFTPLTVLEANLLQPSNPTSVLRMKSIDAIEVPDNVRGHIGNIHQYFMAVNSSLSTKTSRSAFRRASRRRAVGATMRTANVSNTAFGKW